MQQSIDFYIAKSSQGNERLDQSPERICIRWKENDEIVRIKMYTLQELDDVLDEHKNDLEFSQTLQAARECLQACFASVPK